MPYTDFTYYGPKENRFDVIPWVKEVSDQDSLVKDRWIKVIYNGTKNSNTQKNICYCQWADAGPYESDDVEYVFGTAQPAITIGLKSGIDLSPAMQNCLNMGDHNDYVSWQFVDEPIEGPWTNIVTNSPPDWN